MKKSLLFLFALFLSLGTMFGQAVWENDPETNSITDIFEDNNHPFWNQVNSNQTLKINGEITKEELERCASEFIAGDFSELDLSDALLDFETVPAGLFFVNKGRFGVRYRKVTFPSSVVGLSANAFMGSTSIEEIHFNGPITSFAEGALSNCSSLTSIYLYSQEQIKDIEFKQGWASGANRFTFYVNNYADDLTGLTELSGFPVESYNKPPKYTYTFNSSIFDDVQAITYQVNGGEPVEITSSVFASIELDKDDVFSFEITANSSYKIINAITSAEVFYSEGFNKYSTVVTKDAEINITFVQGVAVQVFINPEEGGTLDIVNSNKLPVNNGDIVLHSTSLTVTPNPDSEYVFVSLEANNNIISPVNGEYIISVPASGILNIVGFFTKGTTFVNGNILGTADLSRAASITLSGEWNTTNFSALSRSMNKNILEEVIFAENMLLLEGTELNNTFGSCPLLKTFKVNTTSDAKIRMISTFSGCTSLESIDLRTLNISHTSALFNDCSSLRYIYLGSSEFTGSSNDFNNVTPNVLIYGNGVCPASWDGMNFISGNTAKSITLEHGKPFFCPEPFTAENISYTRTFGKESGINDLAGYEALVLPFTPQTYTTDGNRTLAPWDQYDLNPSAYNIPFWLMQAKGGSNIEVAEMTANEPYLVCFPNNSRYSESVNVKGAVTFSALDAQVYATEMEITTGPAFRLEGTYETVKSSSYIYAMNDKGDCFENSGRNIVPFEAYASPLTSGASFSAPRIYISGVPSRLDRLMKDSSELYNVYVRSGDLVIEAKEEATITIYSVTGVLVKTVNLFEGENVVSDLNKGIYIVSGKKVII